MVKVVSVNFPDIGEGVVEGEIIEWLKQVNDPVKEHEPVVIVMTDKATVELPSPYAGKIVKQYFQVGQMAIRDKPFYDVEISSDVDIPIEIPHKISLEKLKKPSIPNTPPLRRPQEKSRKALSTPPVRQLAKELGLNINEVVGSGQEGRVTKEDVIHHHQEKKIEKHEGRAAPVINYSTPVLHWDDDEEFPLRGLRHLIAEKMVESKYIIPHFSFFDQMDASRLMQMREKIKKEAEKEGIALTYMPFFIRALSLAVKRFPLFNSSIDLSDNTLILHKHHNIGIAFKTSAGLMVPVLKNIQEMSLREIIKAFNALKEKAASGKFDLSDMRESTITISNFGTLGGLWATPIINYPEVAILGVAKIHKEPVVVNDEIVIRMMLNLSWSFDHRIIDGDAAAEFSNFFMSLLKNPAGLL